MPLRRTVTVQLDHERTLRYPLNAVCRFEESAGISITAAFNTPTMKVIRQLVWAGLIHEDPDLTVEAVGDMIDFGQLKDVFQQIKKTIAPDDETNPIDGGGGPIAALAPVPMSESTGTNFGASDGTT